MQMNIIMKGAVVVNCQLYQKDGKNGKRGREWQFFENRVRTNTRKNKDRSNGAKGKPKDGFDLRFFS